LAQSGVGIISGITPMPELKDQWVVSLQFDLLETFKEFWPMYVNDQSSQAVPVPLAMTDINSELLSVGRQKLVQEMIQNVTSDYIDLGVGEPVSTE